MEKLRRALCLIPGHQLRRFNLALLVGLAISLALWVALAARDLDPYVAAIPAVIGAAMLICLAIAAVRGQQLTAAMEAQAATALVRWTYTGDEWAVFSRTVGRRERRTNLLYVLVMLGTGAAIGILGVIIFPNDPGAWPTAISLTLGLPLIAVVQLFIHGDLSSTRGEVLIGPDAVTVAGEYTLVNGEGLRLDSARLEPGQPAIFCIEYSRNHLSTAGGAFHRVRLTEQISVPVPYGHEAEAETLAARLTG